MTTTAYLDLFLRSVTEPALLQTFLSFILLHRHENVHVLDTLVSRINTPFQVTQHTARGTSFDMQHIERGSGLISQEQVLQMVPDALSTVTGNICDCLTSSPIL